MLAAFGHNLQNVSNGWLYSWELLLINQRMARNWQKYSWGSLAHFYWDQFSSCGHLQKMVNCGPMDSHDKVNSIQAVSSCHPPNRSVFVNLCKYCEKKNTKQTTTKKTPKQTNKQNKKPTKQTNKLLTESSLGHSYSWRHGHLLTSDMFVSCRSPESLYIRHGAPQNTMTQAGHLLLLRALILNVFLLAKLILHEDLTRWQNDPMDNTANFEPCKLDRSVGLVVKRPPRQQQSWVRSRLPRGGFLCRVIPVT